MRLNYAKCKELLVHCRVGNIAEVVELLGRDDIDVNFVPKVTRSGGEDTNAISYAAAGGHAEIVKLLLEKGANANCHKEYLKSPLHQAIENRHAQTALTLIEHGRLNFHEPSSVDYSLHFTGVIAIRDAINNKLFDVVHVLLKAGACDIPRGGDSYPGVCKRIAFDILTSGDDSIFKEFVLNHKSAWAHDWDSIYYFCRYAKPELIEAFIEVGGNFNYIRNLYSRGLLHFSRTDPSETLSVRKIFLEKICNVAIEDIGWIFPEKNWNDMSGFLQHDSDINTRGALGITPLMIAAQLGDDALIDRMIKAGADITAINDFGGTALTMAMRVGNEKVVEKLVLPCRLALFSDAVVTNDIETVREFVNLRQIDINHADESGKNALMHSCENENLEMAEVLLGKMIWTFDLFEKHESLAPTEMRADINARDKNGNTALAHSCMNGRNSAISLLLKNGADANSTNNDGDSALALCCESGNINGAKLLLSKGADINTQNAEGNTALMISCSRKDAGMVHVLMSCFKGTQIRKQGKVKYVLDNLPNVDIRNNEGKTALMLSYMGEPDPDIINSLKSAFPEEMGPFDSYGQTMQYLSIDEMDYHAWAPGGKKQRIAFLNKFPGIDDQEEVQLLSLADLLGSHSDDELDAADNADDGIFSLASLSVGHLL